MTRAALPWAILAALAAAWAVLRPRAAAEPPRTAFIVASPALGALRPAERCTCGHLGELHDPDIGCLGAGWSSESCRCRRRGCACPGDTR